MGSIKETKSQPRFHIEPESTYIPQSRIRRVRTTPNNYSQEPIVIGPRHQQERLMEEMTGEARRLVGILRDKVEELKDLSSGS